MLGILVVISVMATMGCINNDDELSELGEVWYDYCYQYYYLHGEEIDKEVFTVFCGADFIDCAGYHCDGWGGIDSLALERYPDTDRETITCVYTCSIYHTLSAEGGVYSIVYVARKVNISALSEEWEAHVQAWHIEN